MKRPSYCPKRQADENQVEALARMRGKEAFALLMAMRTRKTKVILDDFGEMELSGKTKDLLVIAPAGSYRDWEVAIADDLSSDLQDRSLVFTWSSGPGKEERRRLEQFIQIDNRPRILLVNIEALSRAGEAREVVKKFLSQREDAMAVVDESTIIKNNSERTKFVLKNVSPRAKYRRIMSGLATPRSPLDIYYQFEFLDWHVLGHKSWYTFRNHVAFMKTQWFGGRSVLVVDKEQGENGFRLEAISNIQRKIAPYSFRVQFKSKVESEYLIRRVEMTKEQKTHYAEMRDFATTKLSETSHVTATVVIAQLMRMHQILCGHTIDENGLEKIIPENKTSELMELLDDYDGKAVIWCSYDHDVRKVSSVLEKEYGPGSVARFWGGNLKTREAEEKMFKTSPSCRFMVATPAAGGRGRTWDMADLTVYYSSTDNLEHREQSEQRTMGKDKTRGVDVVDLIAPDTVEMKILQALRKKINMASAINGDNYKDWLI